MYLLKLETFGQCKSTGNWRAECSQNHAQSGKVRWVWKIEVGKLAQMGNLGVGIIVKSGKLSREINFRETCGQEKDVAPLDETSQEQIWPQYQSQKGPKPYFNKSKKVHIGSYTLLYKTLLDYMRPYETRSWLSTFWSHLEYFKTFLLFWVSSQTLSQDFLPFGSHLGYLVKAFWLLDLVSSLPQKALPWPQKASSWPWKNSSRLTLDPFWGSRPKTPLLRSNTTNSLNLAEFLWSMIIFER